MLVGGVFVLGSPKTETRKVESAARMAVIPYRSAMNWTRREFLLAWGVAAGAAALPASLPDSDPANPTPLDGPAYLEGDPYLATAPGPGLGGRGFEEARERALRFRTPAEARDLHALGVEGIRGA
jgi:hypothetical protein